MTSNIGSFGKYTVTRQAMNSRRTAGGSYAQKADLLITASKQKILLLVHAMVKIMRGQISNYLISSLLML